MKNYSESESKLGWKYLRNMAQLIPPTAEPFFDIGSSDFRFQKPKSGFNTVRHTCGKPGICSDTSCETHSLRFLEPEVWVTVEKP